METSMYNDDSFTSREREKISNLKKSMRLEFSVGQHHQQQQQQQQQPPSKKMRGPNCLLSSPDLNMLKLGSPELEKLIIQGHGLVTTTPTPNQAPILFPRNVTEEQEMYARGFVDALNELHTTNYVDGRSVVVVDPDQHHHQQQQQQQQHQQQQQQQQIVMMTLAHPTESDPRCTTGYVTATQALGSGSPPTTNHHQQAGYNNGNSNNANAPFLTVTEIKEEPQTVPSAGVTPPLSPIDMMAQERIKLERKRQRNRIAASKCRRRKLERIARLEDKVKLLKAENMDLANVASKLRDSVCSLKQQIMDHASNGCQVLPQSQFDLSFADD